MLLDLYFFNKSKTNVKTRQNTSRDTRGVESATTVCRDLRAICYNSPPPKGSGGVRGDKQRRQRIEGGDDGKVLMKKTAIRRGAAYEATSRLLVVYRGRFAV